MSNYNGKVVLERYQNSSIQKKETDFLNVHVNIYRLLDNFLVHLLNSLRKIPFHRIQYIKIFTPIVLYKFLFITN